VKWQRINETIYTIARDVYVNDEGRILGEVMRDWGAYAAFKGESKLGEYITLDAAKAAVEKYASSS
jgi:hypothetical protein